jgi:hypothetical protein
LEAKENLIDSKREVDNHLKKSCESFIENVSEDLFGNIKQLVKQVRTFYFESYSNNSLLFTSKPF